SHLLVIATIDVPIHYSVDHPLARAESTRTGTPMISAPRFVGMVGESQPVYSERSLIRAALGLAPMICLTTSPSEYTFNAGIEVIRYAAAVCGFSSTLSFTICRLSCESAISSRTGAIWRHGPHHSAQKSTSTGLSLFRTVWAKSASVDRKSVV